MRPVLDRADSGVDDRPSRGVFELELKGPINARLGIPGNGEERGGGRGWGAVWIGAPKRALNTGNI